MRHAGGIDTPRRALTPAAIADSLNNREEPASSREQHANAFPASNHKTRGTRQALQATTTTVPPLASAEEALRAVALGLCTG